MDSRPGKNTLKLYPVTVETKERPTVSSGLPWRVVESGFFFSSSFVSPSDRYKPYTSGSPVFKGTARENACNARFDNVRTTLIRLKRFALRELSCYTHARPAVECV